MYHTGEDCSGSDVVVDVERNLTAITWKWKSLESTAHDTGDWSIINNNNSNQHEQGKRLRRIEQQNGGEMIAIAAISTAQVELQPLNDWRCNKLVRFWVPILSLLPSHFYHRIHVLIDTNKSDINKHDVYPSMMR